MCYKNGMPIYEYSCAKCGKRIEVLQKMSDNPLRTHKGCGGKLTKEISASGFQFKGTGWYVTDYAKKTGGPEPSESGKDSSTESAKPAESSSSEKKESAPKAEKAEKTGKTEKAEKADKPSKTSSKS